MINDMKIKDALYKELWESNVDKLWDGDYRHFFYFPRIRFIHKNFSEFDNILIDKNELWKLKWYIKFIINHEKSLSVLTY